MKIRRNAPCHCGSGLKHKRCCFGKKNNFEEEISMSTDNFLGIVRFGLENLNSLSPDQRNVNIKNISVLDINTLVCEFYSNYSRSVEVKTEIVPIMGFLSGLLKGDFYVNNPFTYFATKAFSEEDTELLFAISNRGALDAAGRGDAVEWIKNTYFQDNTPDYRLTRAKIMISEIEQTLRRVISDVYRSKHSNNWWDQGIDPNVSKSVKKTYKDQFGESISEGDVLINYTFTLDLKRIISADWGKFQQFFTSKTDFEDTVVRLNLIRREEAHNREITEQHLSDLEQIHQLLLEKILFRYPEIELSFMVENWRSKIKQILIYKNHLTPVYTAEEFERSSDQQKQHLILQDALAQIDFTEKVASDLRTVDSPLSKKKKHDELVKIFDDYGSLQRQKYDCALNPDDVRAQEIVASIQTQLQVMNRFSEEFLLAEG